MKRFLLLLLSIASLSVQSRAESFSSSTNFIQTLRIGTNEAIFITSLKRSESSPTAGLIRVSISRSNQTTLVPIVRTPFGNIQKQAFAGPMDLQFQDLNVVIELQRIKTTDAFTTIVSQNSAASIDVPEGKTIHFMQPFSFILNGTNDFIGRYGLVTISNNIVVLQDDLFEEDSFTGPVNITFSSGSRFYGSFSGFANAWVTYYFTDDFQSVPNVGATVVPAGKNVISIEKSQDLQRWQNVFLAPVESDQSGFYRFNFAK